ncbi:Protein MICRORCHIDIA 6 [Linum grandiflorum]
MRAVTYVPVTLESRGKFSQTVEQLDHQEYYTNQSGRQEPEENSFADIFNTPRSGSTILEQEQSPVNDADICSTSTLPPAPPCRQFWKAGSYNDAHCSKAALQNGKNYLHVHPMFLHSNATSHKWAFGAIAELLDNAVDEVTNGATYVKVDKVSNPRDGDSALLIQDDGAGMDPEAIRQCLSFGFSEKKFSGAIGQYGNGFKTSSMRLGADVIIFTRHMKDWKATQSIGLLSYSFLMHMGHDRIIVPIYMAPIRVLGDSTIEQFSPLRGSFISFISMHMQVDYEFNTETNRLEISSLQTKESFDANLLLLMQWSPYSTETELLKQFDDVGVHGTKVVIYNLWYNDDGNLELDFDTDLQDICIEGYTREVRKVNEQHLATRLHYSLHHVITTIGFVKDAPRVSIHGFNIYHKNRLIKPFMEVVDRSGSRGRGVVGILEANFMEPTHNKQDFERTSLFQKLEVRFKDMTMEYWEKHKRLIGYQVPRKVRKMNHPYNSPALPPTGQTNSPMLDEASPNHTADMASSSSGVKRKNSIDSMQIGCNRKLSRTGESSNVSGSNSEGPIAPCEAVADQQQQNVASLMLEKTKLLAQLVEYEKRKEELESKVTRLTRELEEANGEYDGMMAKLTIMDTVNQDY